jgi:hypothetical protein
MSLGRLTWGSIRADVECRASYASGIIGGTHVPLSARTHARLQRTSFSLGSLYCLGAVEVQGRRRPETFGGGHWQGKADSSRPGCSRGSLVVEAARSRWGLLDNRHRTTVGQPDRLEAFCPWHGKARQGMHSTKAKSSVLWLRGLLSLAACVPSRPQPQPGRMGKRSPTIRSGEGSRDCPSTHYGELDANAGWRSRGG